MHITLRSGNIQNASKKDTMNFKKLLFVLPVMALISCGGTSEPGVDTDTTATVTPELIDSNTVTSANATEVKFYEDNVESVTRYFYASRIRGDKDWESVCHLPEERSPKFTEDLAELDQKIIVRYTHISTDCVDNVCNVKMELEWADKNNNGMDALRTDVFEYIAFLENIDGIWWIVGFSDSVPA